MLAFLVPGPTEWIIIGGILLAIIVIALVVTLKRKP